MRLLDDVARTAGERQFLAFRASVLATLSARPEFRRLGVLLQSDDGFRLVAVDGVSCVFDLWSWLLANAPELVRDAPQSAALIIPRALDGSICPVPAATSFGAFDLDVWVVDDCRRVENTGFRCVTGRKKLTRLPWRTGDVGPIDAVAMLLGTLLAENRTPPAAPTRLRRPAEYQPPQAYDAAAVAFAA
jgi:hypothetical protein